MATDPQRMAHGAPPFAPFYSANIIQAGQIFPGAVIQAGGETQCAGQPLSPPQQNPQLGVLDKMLQAETKTLGVGAFNFYSGSSNFNSRFV